MRINPGGRLEVADIIGRDDDIKRYWGILRRQGLVLSAERRIGKTHIAMKMCGECEPGFLPFYQDLEGIHSIKELLRAIYNTVDRSLSNSDRWKNRLAKWSTLLPQRIGNLDLTAVHDNWGSLLVTAFDDLVEVSGDQTVLMVWDEFPLMLYNLCEREDEKVAIELLDQLRALRQKHGNKLRFLLTGSIGLHLVIRSLRKAGNANDPVNDLYASTVPPMAPQQTRELATALLGEIDVDPTDEADIATLLAEEVGGFPYYIHHVADQLQQLCRRVTRDDVVSAIDGLVYDPQDPANFRYYVSRIDTYYESIEKSVALAILDGVAGHGSPQSTEQIINLVRHKGITASEEDIRAVLSLLVEDHYLIKTRHKQKMSYDFRWKLVKRWWQETRT